MPEEKYDFATEFRQVYMSYQRPPSARVPEEMKTQLQCYPPLGQVTTAGDGETTFTAVLHIPPSVRVEGWEVALWFSLNGAEWTETSLTPIKAGTNPQTLQALPGSISRLYFTCSVRVSSSMQFTLKFRSANHEVWRWVRDERGLDDGFVLAATPRQVSEALQKAIPDLNHDWKVSSHENHSSSTQLWSLEFTLPPVERDNSVIQDVVIGTPWGSYLRWFSLVRVWAPWLAPRHGKSHFTLDKDAILCSFLSPRGDNLVFLALGGLGDVSATFRDTGKGGISVHARNDGKCDGKATILVSRGPQFEQCVEAVMQYARRLVTPPQAAAAESVHVQRRENWYDGLGYCTWNALGQKLTEEKVLDAVQKLAEHEIDITSLIIDDNWQSINKKGESQFQYAWNEFEADREAFPRGLKGLVSQIRDQYPGIQHIAVWHALLGYWGGIAPGGKVDQSYKTVEVTCAGSKRRNLPLGGPMTVVAEEDVDRFYNDFYRFLTDAGIDGVKTDAQFILDTWVSASVRRQLINKYLDTWSATSLRYFGIKAISCMSQMPQALFHSQMPHNRPPLVVRNSDDFFPEIPASHPWHVWTNAHNSILTRLLNVLPDWDMFQTVHDYSGFHAAARCVSGGPIYVTDVPGEHNMDLIGQMTGVTTQGRTVIFRPSDIGRSVCPYAGFDDGLLLKVGSQHHATSKHGIGILGVFNISPEPLLEIVPLSCFPDTSPSLDYVVRAHATGKLSMPTRAGQPNSLLTVSLDTRGYEILCAYPLTAFASEKHKGGWVANLGLVGKMTGCAAMSASNIHQDEKGVVSIETRLKALGVLGIYVSAPAARPAAHDLRATIGGQPVPQRFIRVSKEDESVFEVDLESAWKEMGIGASSGNEVEARVSFCG